MSKYPIPEVITEETFDPKLHFKRIRRGKTYFFSKQIRNWRRSRKAKGCLKDSKASYEKYLANKNAKKKVSNLFG